MTGPDRRAVADTLPLFIPAVPFGFVVGLATTESAMPTWVAWLTSPLVFAGAAQLTMLTLAGSSALLAVIVAALVVNARHLMYSAAAAPAFGRQPRWFRWLSPHVLIDQTFAISSLHFDDEPAAFRRYYVTSGLIFIIGWQVAVALGMVVGPVIPDSWHLGFAAPVMFTGLTVMAASRRPAVVAVVVGAAVSLAAIGLPNRLGILAGALCGVIAGWLAERRLVEHTVDQKAGQAESGHTS